MAHNDGIDSRVWLQHTWRNRLHSIVLLIFMGGFLAVLGGLFWGPDGIFILVTVGIVSVLFSPALSPRLVMRLYGASPVHPNQAPALWNAVSQLSARAGLPRRPELYYVPSRMLNALDPDGLAHALAKIERVQGGWLECIFMPGRGVPEPSLLRTHPETRERIARSTELKPELAREGGLPSLATTAFDARPVFGQPVMRPPRWHISGLWY